MQHPTSPVRARQPRRGRARCSPPAARLRRRLPRAAHHLHLPVAGRRHGRRHDARALCTVAAEGARPDHRGREQGRRLRHARPEGAGERQARRLHDRPDPDLGDALLAARHGADRSAEGPHLHRAHLGPDLRHRGARRRAVEDAEGLRRRRQGQPRQAHLRAAPASAARRTSAWRSSRWPPASSSTTFRTRAARRRCRTCSAARSTRWPIPARGRRTSSRASCACSRPGARSARNDFPDVPTLQRVRATTSWSMRPTASARRRDSTPPSTKRLREAFKVAAASPEFAAACDKIDAPLMYLDGARLREVRRRSTYRRRRC